MTIVASAEQEAMRDSVRRLVKRTIRPLMQAHDRNAALPKTAWMEILGELATLGLAAARLPENAGGPGIDMLDYGMMFELLPAPAAVTLVAHEATTARIHAEASPEQRRRFLPDLVAGRRMACTASTEPGAGSDPRGIRTRLTRKDGRLVLNGAKMWITNVSQADVMLATCLDHREGTDGAGVVKVILEREVAGYEAREIETVGLRQGLLGECVFEDCPVAPEDVVEAETGGGTAALKASWAVNRPLYGLIAVGLAQRAADIALDYARTRRQFGREIGGHQLVQRNLSDIVTAVTTSRLVCHHALAMIDRGEPAEGTAAMAKRYAQEACREAVFQAMNVLGAMGLATETGIEEIWRDIRMIPVPDGTNEILALIHGRELTGIGAFRPAPADR